jgi:Protein of unknown function (DUF4238)
MFCAMRAWDTPAERRFKSIEDEFQGLAEEVISGSTISIGKVDKYKVDRFFGLWKWRAHFRNDEMQDIQLSAVTGTEHEEMTRDDEERLEKAGVLSLRKGGKIAAHRWNGLRIDTAINHELLQLSPIRWTVVRASAGQFLVPDFPTILYIPLHPTLSLCGSVQVWNENASIARDCVININRQVVAECRDYFFAKNLAECL